MTFGVFIDGYLQGRELDQRMRCAPCPLTMKQRECLAWRSEGKKNQDIATMRGVSLRAIDEVLKGARNDLGVETTDHAMAIAIRRQWI
jgi:DNA-binding CsgD family transcriptional regulator